MRQWYCSTLVNSLMQCHIMTFCWTFKPSHVCVSTEYILDTYCVNFLRLRLSCFAVLWEQTVLVFILSN